MEEVEEVMGSERENLNKVVGEQKEVVVEQNWEEEEEGKSPYRSQILHQPYHYLYQVTPVSVVLAPVKEVVECHHLVLVLLEVFYLLVQV